MLFPDQAGSGLVIIQTCGLESPGENQALFVCLISPFGRLQFVSLSSLDQTELINNVAGYLGEAMAGGLW